MAGISLIRFWKEDSVFWRNSSLPAARIFYCWCSCSLDSFLSGKRHYAEGACRETDWPGYISGMTEMLLIFFPAVRERSIRMSL